MVVMERGGDILLYASPQQHSASKPTLGTGGLGGKRSSRRPPPIKSRGHCLLHASKSSPSAWIPLLAYWRLPSAVVAYSPKAVDVTGVAPLTACCGCELLDPKN
uniref:Uncharacterized protein n=1 Tax=Oryza sativa subsp. japonica TaxID=39947 RepID=Q6K4U6_ORYSJ|nr:hypothetical protein [Oryza sativa Japonica Group]